MSDSWKVTPVSAALGAVVEGLSLSASLAGAEVERLRDLLAQHHVLVLPDQELNEDTHVELGSLFGTPYLHPFLTAHPDQPAVLEVLKNETDEATFGGEYWHADITFTSPPAAVSLLHGLEIPPLGGDTLFANQFLAFERLSPRLQELLETLDAHHTYPGMTEEDPRAHALHPVVRRHPRSGRRALFVNPAFVSRFDGMTAEESRPLLEFLFEHQVRPEFQGRVSWRPNQLTIWDNRAVQHYAMNDYPGQRRRLQRVTVLESGVF